MRKLTMCCAAAAAGVLLAASASAASASDGGGWRPTHTDPFEFPAGALCPFGLKGDILYDREYTRVTASYPDGSPRIEEFTGPLGIRFHNEANGKAIDRDVTGFTRLLHQEDGSRVFSLWGNSVAPIYPGTGVAGDYVTHGYFVLVVHADKSREYTVRQGESEDICRTLA
ncbi:hypothetical protein [Kutzneria sp. NPDC052558]|uniref:hypothetical protein n=1 Tax=Kutzneria sp. NPDC052558 TaxID=3364121 RepID=UPI0037C55CC7